MEISNKRCIQILKLLLKNKECMTGDNLAVAIGVSSRTIRNDMKDLNRALEDHGASVVSEIGQGYYLKIEDQEKFLAFQNEMEEQKREKDFKNIIPSEPEDRVKYIISKLLLSILNGRKEKIQTRITAQAHHRHHCRHPVRPVPAGRLLPLCGNALVVLQPVPVVYHPADDPRVCYHGHC